MLILGDFDPVLVAQYQNRLELQPPYLENKPDPVAEGIFRRFNK
jgi:hypothetical protein